MTEAELEGFTMASFTIGVGLMKTLQSKGLLTKGEVQNLLEGALQTLEQDSPEPNSPGFRTARALLDAIAQIAATDGTMKPKGPQ